MRTNEPPGLSLPLVSLLRGLVHRDSDEALWQNLIGFQAAIRDYLAVIGLELVLDEAEGFAWLRTATPVEGQEPLPRLMTRRQLPYLPSLLLALLRKKLVETDASGEGQRLVLSRDELVELVRVFLPASTNEARLTEQVVTALNKIEELGFVRRLKGQNQLFEVRRILKAFVDAQWLADFDTRLEAYRNGGGVEGSDGEEAETEDRGVAE